MMKLRKVANVFLIILTGFLALTGILGGIALLANINTPPLEQLQGSIFTNWAIPGLGLFVFVGGSALLATILLIRKNKYGVLFAMVAGIIIMFFEFVEVQAIGSPPGVAQTLQVFYFGLGMFIAIVSIGIWFTDLSFEE